MPTSEPMIYIRLVSGVDRITLLEGGEMFLAENKKSSQPRIQSDNIEHQIASLHQQLGALISKDGKR